MKQVGINLQVHYIPVHLQPYYKRLFGFEDGDYPVAESFYGNEVSIPLYPKLKDKEIEHVISEIQSALD